MKILFLLIFLIFLSQSVFSQADPCRKSTEGTDFWFGFMESRTHQTGHYVEITVTARETTSFTITIGPRETPFNSVYTVLANGSLQIQIPWNLVEPLGSEIVQDLGIHLKSEKPVNVYALNWSPNSADVAVIYPSNSLGKEYFAMCYYPDIDINNPTKGNGRNSEFVIVATEDSTRIEITPSKVTDQLRKKDTVFVVYLNKGQIYQVQSENALNTSQSGQGDLTGSYVLASKPIAFFSGSLSTRIPVGYCCWDHLYEQIPPVHSWGLEYYAIPLKTREQDRYRIMASQNNTTVFVTGRAPIKLNRGQFEEIVIYYNEPKRIFSDKPILVAQFSQSRDVDPTFTGGNGDPFMIILSSSTQSKNDVTFVAYNSVNIKSYYVNIVTLTSEVKNILLDDVSILSDFKPLPGNEYSYAQKLVTPGTHRIYNTNKEKGFIAYVYGFGGVESYGYGVGFNLDLVLDLGKSIDFNGDTLLLCDGETRILDAGPYFDTFKWDSGETTQKLAVSKGGKYKVKVTTVDGCKLQDSIYVFLSSPKTNLAMDYDEGCSPYSRKLDGNPGFSKYLWQNQTNDTLSTSRFYTASQTGEYRITAFDKYNCPARDTMKLVVFPVPEVKLKGNKLVCGVMTSKLDAIISGTKDSVWKNTGSFKWFTNKPVLLSFKNTNHEKAEFAVTKWGDYEIYYQLTTINNCVVRDSFKVTFHPQPTADFIFENDSKCEGYSKKLLFTGIATDSAKFYWDLDGCKFTDTLGWQVYNVSVGAYLQKQPYIKLFINDKGCITDTIRKPLGANPNFTMEASKLRGCDSLTVSFKSELTVNDSVDFKWEFHDGQTFPSKNALKHYSSPGFYSVTLSITNPASGCQNGFTVDSMVRVYPTPVAKITADPDFCYPDSAILFYTHSIDSSFCTWNFDGIRKIGPGNDTVNVIIEKPAGKAELIVNEYGCISNPSEITIKRKPHFDFTSETNSGCQPFLVRTDAVLIDNNLEFFWKTDSLPFPKGNSNYYYFPNTGKYSITLFASSKETGCMDSLIKKEWIEVYLKPDAYFEVDYPVALKGNSKITFSNYSRDAVKYFWDFGDLDNSKEINPIHTYTEIGKYKSILVAETEFGCKDTFEVDISVEPFSVYSPNAFRPDSEIPENKTFMPVGRGADRSKFNLKIFNRWGQVVFESNSPENPWNGNDRKGNPAPSGNYVWFADFIDIQGFRHKEKGQVILIR